MTNNSNREPQAGFWKRKLFGPRTAERTAFDIVCGLVLPILCFYFDPIVFQDRNRFWERMDLSSGLLPFKPFVYAFSAIAILALSLLLIPIRKKAGLLALLSGSLFAGFAGSLLIGIRILPLTLEGLWIGLGIFGFIPFFTAFTYLRNAIRAWREATVEIHPRTGSTWALAGVLVLVGGGFMAHKQLHRAVVRLAGSARSGDENALRSDLHRLQYVAWAADLEPLLSSDTKSTDEDQRRRIAGAYNALTGEDIQMTLGLIRD